MEQRSVLVYGAAESTEDLYQQLDKRGWQFYVATNRQDFTRLYHHHRFDVVIVYLNKDYLLETSLLEELSSINIASKWLAIISDSDWFEQHPNFLFNNIFHDYHREPLRLEHFMATLGHAYGMAQLQNKQLNQESLEDSEHDFIGNSKEAIQLKQLVAKVSQEKACVLLTGESGTGKELVAQNIHQSSLRPEGPFVAISCNAIAQSLFYSELFGHKKGAFAGAEQQKDGRILAAQGGTLFLDEIGDVPFDLQLHLLRFLESGQIEPLGSQKPIQVDCRVIVSSNIDLTRAVAEGRFREDLYHRINVLHLPLPTLRKRAEDIPLLANFFLKRYTGGKSDKSFSQNCYAAMQQYSWPGNVRELMNRVQRAVILSDGSLINENHLDLNINSTPMITSLEEARGKAEREALISSIEQAGYNHTLAAKNLGISRTSLYRLINKHQLPM